MAEAVIRTVADGAGFGLAMAGGIISAAEDASIIAGFPMVGFVADYGLGRTLPSAVGAVRAKDILLTGRKVDAAEALAIGMVGRVVPRDARDAQALTIARKLADGPTVALGLTKKLIDRGSDGGIGAHLDREGFAQATAFGTLDFREGVAAFGNRRAPRFEGR